MPIINAHDPLTMEVDGEFFFWSVRWSDSGLEIRHVYFVDTNEGIVKRYMTDDSGELKLTSNGQEVATETIYGRFIAEPIKG